MSYQLSAHTFITAETLLAFRESPTSQRREYQLPAICIGEDERGNRIEYKQELDGTWSNLYDETAGYTTEQMIARFPEHFRLESEGGQWMTENGPEDDYHDILICVDNGAEVIEAPKPEKEIEF